MGCLSKAPPCEPQAVATAPSGVYCDVASGLLTIPGGARLTPGEAVLYSIDRATAVVLARDDGGLFAVSGICTHQCCPVVLCDDGACKMPRASTGECTTSASSRPSFTDLALYCPCHGSSFTIDGRVLGGPAPKRLPHYALTTTGDDVVVTMGPIVAAEIRF